MRPGSSFSKHFFIFFAVSLVALESLFALAAPTGLSSSGQNLAANLAWSPVDGAASYNIRRSLWNGGPYTTIATGVLSPSFQDTGLLNGTTYYYTVSSVGPDGESDPSIQTYVAPQAVASLPTRPFLHPLFADHLVLQRDALVPVWGWTTPGTSVSVTINGQTKTTTTPVTGRWQVEVGPFAAGGPYTMTVVGRQTVTISDILFGDVFIFSGQSNMERQLGLRPPQPAILNYTNEIAAGNYPNIRQFSIPLSAATRENTVITGSWSVCNPTNVGNFSAVGYFISRNLFKSFNVPIGILHSAYGSTSIDTWMDPVEAAGFPEFTATINALPAQTNPPANPISLVTAVYNNMVAPLAPFRIKGAFWYQGEANTTNPYPYHSRLPALMKGWRRIFGQPNLPFVVCQLPGYSNTPTTPVETGSWAEQREAQKKPVEADPYSRLVINIDVGEADIHPPDKQDVGYRASLAARDVMYGQTLVSQGPLFTAAVVEGSAIRCSFSNLGGGLMVGAKTLPPNSGPVTADVAGGTQPATEVVGGTLTGFAIAGEDKNFVAATATISGDTVVVSAAGVAAPLYVRYGWANRPSCNLYNKILDGNGNILDGLPASPFRNDPLSRLSVVNGTGTNTYAPGSQVGITANNITGGTFSTWFGDTAFLNTPGSRTATATLGRTYVSVGPSYTLTAAPASPSATGASVAVNLSWTTVTQATSYNVKRSTSASGPFNLIASGVLTTTYSDTSAAIGTPYFYRISASNRVGNGPDTTATVTATAQPPAAPTGLSATAGNGLINLSWNAVSGVSGYSISRSTVSGGPYTTVLAQTAGTSYVDTGLANGTAYYYTVAALANGSTSSASTEATATPSNSTTLVVRSVNGTSSASAVSSNQTDVQAFDQTTTTKWLTQTPTGWLQYQFKGTSAWAISEYRITSANDTPNRHPKNWDFLGSNDGSFWTTLDSRTNQTYGSQYLVRTYAIPTANVAPYRFYRLNVTANNGEAFLQLADLTLFSPPTDPGDKTAPVFDPTQNLSVTTTDSAGRAVSFSVTAYDTVSGAIPVTSTPASGSMFPVGVTTVTSSATDSAGNTATTSFTVRVIDSTVPVSTAAPQFTFDGTTSQLSLPSIAGHVYQLQRSYDLTGAWENVGAPIEGGGTLQITDTPVAGQPNAFYRFLIDP